MVSVYQVLWITVHLNLKNLNKTKQLVYVSATPGPYEIEHTDKMVEQIIRPTGLLDPKIDVRPTKNQIDDLLSEIQERIDRNERVLVTTLTKNE